MSGELDYVRAAVDRDGDVWGERENGTWRCLSQEAGRYYDLDKLAEVYGPLLLTGQAAEVMPPYPAVGSEIPPEENGGQTGYRVGECGHRVAGQEWDAGFRVCERCPS